MIRVVLSELFRTLTVRSAWVSMICYAALGVVTGWFSPEFWALFIAIGAFAVTVVVTAQHYQNRTAVLLFLGQPHRLVVLAALCVTGSVVALVTAAVSGISVVGAGDGDVYRYTLMVVPLVAVFGVANAILVRRAIWLLAGWGLWMVTVEGVIGKFESRLPLSSMLIGMSGNLKYLLAFAVWTALFLGGAIWSIRRDLSGS